RFATDVPGGTDSSASPRNDACQFDGGYLTGGLKLFPAYVFISGLLLSLSNQIGLGNSAPGYHLFKAHEVFACPAFRERGPGVNADEVALPVMIMMNPVHSGSGNFASWLEGVVTQKTTPA